MWTRRLYLFYSLLTLTGALVLSEALDFTNLDSEDDAIETLYDISPQLEYVLPAIFPDHRVERKAQRSPSLRLRFGRSASDTIEEPKNLDPRLISRWVHSVPDRTAYTALHYEDSIPDMIHDAEKRSPSLRLRFGRRSILPMPELLSNSPEKRWFGGDVNKKPIRSPSLRLRFGRRSDPSMPLRSSFDELMDKTGGVMPDSLNAIHDYDNDVADYDEIAFRRVLRKPEVRLRWGRSMPMEIMQQSDANFVDSELQSERHGYDALLSDLTGSEKLRNMLLAVRNFKEACNNDDNNSEAFQREARKPAPLRLRFGRSVSMKKEGVADKAGQKLKAPEGDVNKV